MRSISIFQHCSSSLSCWKLLAVLECAAFQHCQSVFNSPYSPIVHNVALSGELRVYALSGARVAPRSGTSVVNTVRSLPSEHGGVCMRVVGVDHKQGMYEGKVYDNYQLHCLTQDPASLIKGEACEIIKIKAPRLAELFGMVMTEQDLVSLVGAEISVYYDRYRNPTKIDIVALDVGSASQHLLDNVKGAAIMA